ncbi:MAG TPA: 3-deoxy-7-phosphoheptulonate synthase [Candidatus Stercoripulliclostridium merdigallinarum]|uniref:3-deoxy-7-phosphoheptulonate synthase n=1 Tax=Candidatus Stercoripulliclostridium merdigallinarum TaxID=2840951 RepID=A0A9D1MGV6_9FIRM|nr:3-deoxy-7-phosphoheptulonate synthase [Candidatus Stercoripulliclostridium merdigallinarum]
MIVTVKQGSNPQQVKRLTSWIKSLGLDVHVSEGEKSTVIGLVGDTSKVDIDLIRSLDIVEAVTRIQEPYKNANRKFHPEDSIIDVSGVKFGGKHFQMIAGPCSVESEQQVIGIAEAVKASGATMLRGGAFKPRTSPYAFQGLGLKGLEILKKAREVTGLPIVTEIMSERYIDAFAEVDMVQIGARNMQNFDLLKAVGRLGKPVLLKRGLANTIEEWLMSAEYIMSEGNMNIVLCERGIRTFEPYTRNTLDLSAIPILKEKTHLPVIVDPSHASGLSRLVKPMSLASVGAGADGLIIEVHNDPPHALCDGAQSLRPEQFDDVVKAIDVMLPLVNKERG